MTEEILQYKALFPISVVKELTGLTARQIRYYEENGLVIPKRNSGNHRIFSVNDIIRCLEIKQYIDQGVNIAGIKAVYDIKEPSIESAQEKKTSMGLAEKEIQELLIKVKKMLFET